MISVIHIERLALTGFHGVMPQERLVGTVFYVTLEAEAEVSDEALSGDELAGTVSYADIISVIRQEMAVPAALLEHLVYRTGQRLLSDFPRIVSLNLRIDKENPPCGVCVDNIGVSMTLSR
ncbi:MAG: dihydroneopterin aldolase [Bacteroidaceae bacterium]|nr:dihydroneopterin aldolase [Bacteroidaceae bacterium]